jgi:translation initiation factor 5A
MSERKLVEATQLKKGSYVMVEGAPCKIVDVKYSKPGKHGHAKINMTAVGLVDDKKRNVVMPGHELVEVPIIEKKNAQVLSISGDIASVMDSETFETFEMKIPEELKESCIEGCTVLYWDLLGEKMMKQIVGKE